MFVWYTETGLYITLHNSSARLDGIFPVQIHLMEIRDSPDHRSVRNKEVNFIYEFTLCGRHLVSFVRIIQVFLKKENTGCPKSSFL